MTYHKEIIDFIIQSTDISLILKIMKCIALVHQKSMLIDFIKHTNAENQRYIYYAIMPITLILPIDILQFIILFNNIKDTALINKLFYSLTIKNENKYYATIYKSIEDKSCYRMTRIVNNNRKLLHPIEISRGYIGPYRDFKQVIISCEHNDRVLIHKGIYYIEDRLTISKNIEIVGLSIKNSNCDVINVEIYFEIHLTISPSIVTFRNLRIMSFDDYAMIIINNSTVIADNCEFQCTNITENSDQRSIIIVHRDCSLKCINCYFKFTEEAILISMKATEINIIESTFEYIFINKTNIIQNYIGCVVIQDHWDIPFTNAEIVKLKAIKNMFNITNDKFPFIEINNNIEKDYVLYNHGSYILNHNVIENNENLLLNPNKLYISNLARKL